MDTPLLSSATITQNDVSYKLGQGHLAFSVWIILPDRLRPLPFASPQKALGIAHFLSGG